MFIGFPETSDSWNKTSADLVLCQICLLIVISWLHYLYWIFFGLGRYISVKKGIIYTGIIGLLGGG